MKKNHHRFLVRSEDIKNELFESGDLNLINQIKNVFRLGIGSQIFVLDGLSNEYSVKIVNLKKDLIQGKILSKKKAVKNKFKISLFCSLLKGDHFEIVLEKCTELGVSFFQPVVFDRSIIRQLKTGKSERYKKIVKEASEQSGRLDLPVIFEPISFIKAVEKIKNGFDLVGIIGANKNILDIKMGDRDTNIFIGPEGDFSEPEIELMKKEGFLFFNLGDNLLRSETAAIVSCGIITQLVL